MGATPQTIRFAGRLQNKGFLWAYQEAGPVAVARVFYPFRSNASEGCVLVNGRPPMVDVDDPDLWPLDALEDLPEYQRLRSSRSGLSVRPGDRAAPGAIAVQRQPDKGWRFLTGYTLRSGGQEGQVVGAVEFAFDFDEQGTFLESAVAGMAKTYHAVAGETVTLTVQRTDQAGSGWQATRVPPADLLRLVSKGGEKGDLEKPRNEAWRFQALEPGRVPVTLQHIPADEQGAWPDQRALFLVVIHASREKRASVLGEGFREAIDHRLQDIQSPMAGKVAMEIVGVAGDTARVDIFPEEAGRFIRAAVYLKQQEGVWQVLSMGTSFEASFYRKHDIPWALRVAEASEDALGPLPLEEVSVVQKAVSEALDAEGRLEPEVPFRDYLTDGRGTGCRITLKGTGARFQDLENIGQAVLTALEGLGWTEDVAYAADGPLGTATGFRRGSRRILVRVLREPAEEVGLLSTEPPSLCELLPEDWAYTITLDCAQRP